MYYTHDFKFSQNSLQNLDKNLAFYNYFNSSQGFNPVCFLKAAEKCDIEE